MITTWLEPRHLSSNLQPLRLSQYLFITLKERLFTPACFYRSFLIVVYVSVHKSFQNIGLWKWSRISPFSTLLRTQTFPFYSDGHWCHWSSVQRCSVSTLKWNYFFSVRCVSLRMLRYQRMLLPWFFHSFTERENQPLRLITNTTKFHDFTLHFYNRLPHNPLIKFRWNMVYIWEPSALVILFNLFSTVKFNK